LRRIDASRFSEGHDGTIIHRVVEDGPRENKTVGESDRHANGNAFAQVAEHAAGGGAVKINGVADSPEQSRNDVWLAIHGKTHVADESFVENFVNRFAIIDTALGLAHH